MSDEALKNTFLFIECIAGILSIAFSMFMMYSMYKVKKSAENISKTAQEMSNTFTQALPMLLQQREQPQIEEPGIIPFELKDNA